MNKTKKKNPGKTVWMIFIILILIIVAGIIVTSIVFKNSDVTPSAFGYSFYIMDDEGMGGAVPQGALVVAKNYSPSAEDIGDAILCEKVDGYGTTVMRLANIVPNTTTVVYQGFFDSEPTTLIDVPADNLIGRAVSYDKTAGAAIRFITSYQGIATLVVVPILILLVCELIIGMYSKKAEKEAKNAKYRRRMRAAEEAAKSPLNAENLKNHKTPVTIDEYIFGQGGKEEPKRSTTGETTKLIPPLSAQKRSQPRTRPDGRPSLKSQRDAKGDRTAAKPTEKPTVYSKTAEKILAEDAAQKAAKAEQIARAEEEARRLKAQQQAAKAEEQKAQAAKEAAAKEAAAKEAAAKAQREKQKAAEATKASPSTEEKSYKSSNESLARLIKLMEEQEKILRQMADKQE